MKIDLDHKKFEGLLTLFIIILIGLEILIFLKSIFSLNIAFVNNLFVLIVKIKDFFYKLAILLGALFILAFFIEKRTR